MAEQNIDSLWELLGEGGIQTSQTGDEEQHIDISLIISH